MKKKEEYRFVPSMNLYRKRDKDLNDGKPIYGKTPKELEAKITALRNEATKRKADEEKLLKKPTFAYYAAKWEKLHSPNVRPQTAEDYHTIIEKHILPVLGDMVLAEITADDVSEALLLVSKLSESVYNKTYMLIKRIFDSAVEGKLIASSPCPDWEQAGKKQKETDALTPEQVDILLDAVKGTSADTFVQLAVYTGMRKSEILALQWDRVYLRSKYPYIKVTRTLLHKNSQPIVSDLVKTESGVRDIPIPRKLLKHLIELHEKSESDFVIHNTSNGPLKKNQWNNLWHAVVCRSTKERVYTKYYPDGSKKRVMVFPQLGERAAHRKYCITIDFEVSPHKLRRTYITRLIASGVDPKTVQYLVGHKNSKMTMDVYAKVQYNRPNEISPLVDRAFGSNSLQGEITDEGGEADGS